MNGISRSLVLSKLKVMTKWIRGLMEGNCNAFLWCTSLSSVRRYHVINLSTETVVFVVNCVGCSKYEACEVNKSFQDTISFFSIYIHNIFIAHNSCLQVSVSSSRFP